MADKQFCKGLYFNETDLTKNIETSEKQFIFFKVSIRKKELIEYLESQNSDDEWVNIDVKRSKTGKFYGEVNTFKPNRDEYNQDTGYQKRSGYGVSKHLRDWEQKQKQRKEDESFDEPPF